MGCTVAISANLYRPVPSETCNSKTFSLSPESELMHSPRFLQQILYFPALIVLFNISRLFSDIRPETCRFQWPRGLRRGSAAAHLLGLGDSNPVRFWKRSRKVACDER